jgi:ssRNA-specific RNase YbeY (16S rRNA maturation enzyme)
MFIEIQEIQKEEIQNCSFKQTIEHVQSSTLSKKLMDAMKMGNNDHRKVEIIFCDDEGLKKVNTTIWATEGEFISLKGGVWIPVSRIVDIIF